MIFETVLEKALARNVNDQEDAASLQWLWQSYSKNRINGL